MVNPGWKQFNRFLDTVGDGSGTKNAIGDFSAATQSFIIKPATNQVISIDKLVIFVKGAGRGNAMGYGSASLLSTGIELIWERNGSEFRNFTDEIPIQAHVDWMRHSSVTSFEDTVPEGNVFSMEWDFREMSGGPIVLHDSKLDVFGVTLDDDFSGTGVALVEHFFNVHGTFRGEESC